MSDEMREKQAKVVYETFRPHCFPPWEEVGLGWRNACLKVVDQILKAETDTLRIAVVRKEGELPAFVLDHGPEVQEMLDDGWVEEVKTKVI